MGVTLDGSFTAGNTEFEMCVSCNRTMTMRRIDMGEPGSGPNGPVKPTPMCTECLAPCMELGDDRCAGDPCVCQMPDSR